MRKLASIQRIKSVEPILGADAIEVATVLGWKCVVKKNEFKPGDLAVYFEVDSFLPIRPEFEFLRSKGLKKLEDGTEGFRLRTIKLRGQISQGLLWSLSILPSLADCEEGKDVTEILNVRPWQPPIPACLKGIAKGSFPSFIPKTDETRVQVLGEVIKRHAGTVCYVTEMVDGSSVTFYLKDQTFGVCSRNIELAYESYESGNAYWEAADKLDIETKLRNYGKNIAIQGELIGNGIQGNTLGIEGRKVLFFNVFDIDAYRYLPFAEFKKVISELGLETVPMLDEAYILPGEADEIIEFATAKSVINPKVEREGIVIRPLVEAFDLEMAKGMGNGRLSFKAINPEYLLSFEG